MHKQDAIYLDQLCPKISNKNWRDSLHKLTRNKCIYCGKPSESLDHLHPKSKGGESITNIAFLVVYHVMGKSLILKYLNGTGVKNSMIQEDLWQLEHGSMMI